LGIANKKYFDINIDYKYNFYLINFEYNMDYEEKDSLVEEADLIGEDEEKELDLDEDILDDEVLDDEYLDDEYESLEDEEMDGMPEGYADIDGSEY
jgi:hypothetical protein